MKSVKFVLIICVLACLNSPAVFACRFNVRDVGFVDLGNQPYGLFCYIDNNTDKDIAEAFKEISLAELPETNIKARTVNVDATPDHPVLEYLKPRPETFPAIVLVSPERESMMIEAVKKGKGFKESLQKTLDEIMSSPIRDELIEKAIEAFGVVLVIEGPDAAESKQAVDAANKAIEQTTRQMSSLPKLVEKPPVLVVLGRQQVAQEKILLWSMGIDADNIKQSHAIIIYGRSRRMGTVLSGKELTAARLTNFLSVIGADCECGLDRAWMQGTMPPLRWGRQRQSVVADKLQFDPENPMIKAEMRQILRKGRQSRTKALTPEDFDGAGMGYREIVIDFNRDTPPEPAAVEKPESSRESERIITNAAVPKQIQNTQQEPAQPTAAFQKPGYIIIVLVILVIIAGLFIVLRGSGDK
jgi:hypothetical protein